MKLIRMRIQRTRESGHTHYEYATPYYVAEKVKMGPIYEGGLDECAKEAQDRGQNDEFILIGVDEVDFDSFMQANGLSRDGFTFTAEEVSRDSALSMGNKWTRQTEKITDQNKVLSILAKVARKEELTEEDERALNPDDPTPGINKTKSFDQILKDHGIN